MTCGNWNSIIEDLESVEESWNSKWISKSLSKIESNFTTENKYITTSTEFNNAIWWGIVEGSLTLLTWEPGIWKSTLTLQIGSFLSDRKIIYVSGEETEWQIMWRAKRLGVNGDNVSLLNENNLENIIETLKDNPSDLVIIDSVSVISSNDISGTAGSISQVKYIAEKLMNYAKKNKLAMILIGHVTKDWNLAWPKVLEHLVDTVLYFEGDKFDSVRILRCIKNRFGSTNEVWIFKMEEKGLIDVKNPWLEFISKDSSPSIGSSLSITLEWTRAVIIETESLTTYTKFGYPKRSSRWIVWSKLDMIVAILGKYTDVKLDSYDVYTNIARGLKIEEPWIDMALCASIISSKLNASLPRDTIYVWEVSLTWKVKNIFSLEKRIKEAEKMGFKKIFVPDWEVNWKYDIEIVKIKFISEIIKYLK